MYIFIFVNESHKKTKTNNVLGLLSMTPAPLPPSCLWHSAPNSFVLTEERNL